MMSPFSLSDVLLVVPVLWSMVAANVVSLGIWEDIALPVAAAVAIAFRWYGRRRG